MECVQDSLKINK
uniref:Uncharacterized protein n=1 Tax=Anguilla anguilla TaxID=7936 RepID=A0A0E9RSD5_ANGAN